VPGDTAPNPFNLPALAAPHATRPRGRGRQRRWSRIAGLVVVLAAVGGGATGIWWLLQHARMDEEVSDGSHASTHNYRFDYPRGWKVDRNAKQALGANLALLRAQPSAGLAVFAHDYKTRSPRDAELHDQAVTWLEKYFRGFE